MVGKGKNFVSLDVTKLKQFKKRIKKLSVNTERGLQKALFQAGFDLENEMIRTVKEVSKGGKYKRGNKTHTASKPGDAPNTDTGGLINSIRTKKERYAVEVGSFDLEYARYLERGTPNMEARPFVRPSYDKLEKTIFENIEDVINKEIGE